jgi:hypothetical protein
LYSRVLTESRVQRRKKDDMKRSVLILIASLLLVSCNHFRGVLRQADTGPYFTLSLQAIEPHIRVGTAPRFRLTLKNVSDHSCRIINAEARVDLQHTYYNLEVTKNGEPVSVLRAISDPGPVSVGDSVEVVPGGTRTFLLTSFPDAFDQLRLGAYKAHVEFWRDPFQS